MLRLATVSLALVSLSGCAAYNTVSVASVVTTGKSIVDHGASLATGADCNLIKHVWTGKYVCERSLVYNQNPL
jgi:hypothetical protein